MTGLIGSDACCDLAEEMAAVTATSPDLTIASDDADRSVIAFTRTWVDRLPSNRVIAAGIGGGRIAIGVSFLSSPVTFLRLMGLDTATASRVTWLARTAGIRDVALGVGTVTATVTGRDDTTWLLAGAACDAVDAVITGAAAREGRIGRLRGGLVAAGAVGSVVAAVAALAIGRSGPAEG
jgi:hypothetical protein